MNFHTPQELDVRNRKQNLVEQSPQEENETKRFLKNIVETTHVILGYGSLFLFRTISFSIFEMKFFLPYSFAVTFIPLYTIKSHFLNFDTWY